MYTALRLCENEYFFHSLLRKFDGFFLLNIKDIRKEKLVESKRFFVFLLKKLSK